MSAEPGAASRSGERFLLEPVEPAYLALHHSGVLAERAAAALRELENCRACPWACQVNRLANQTKVCRIGRYARVASAFPHFGEEDCLRGTQGSGTIFFSLCNLRCVFCQNWDISQYPEGDECPPERLAAIMLALQRQGCHNINFVSPEHVVPQVIESLPIAIAAGLRLPIVYNTGAYDSVDSLRLLDGIVDIYMPDFKFWEPASARRLLKAEDYPERARAAILEMHRQVGPLRLGPDGVARRGVLVRHLVMPGYGAESEAILDWLAREVSPDTYVNLMAQYHPAHEVGQPARDGGVKYAEINRRPTLDEIHQAYQAARHSGLWRFDQRQTM
jgi:putative pyruvate formate lyase activating enzyme